jgi:4-carboxymuconolactone decarboxylase
MTPDQSHTDTFQEGLAIRREVLGEEYVEKSLASVSEFSQPVQEFVTEYVWGSVWSRDGLPRATRSMLNIAMLTALNRSHELSVHVRGALNNGVTPEQIREVLLQTLVYVGAPAALESFRVADKVIKELTQQHER